MSKEARAFLKKRLINDSENHNWNDPTSDPLTSELMQEYAEAYHAEKSEQEIKRVYDWLMDENREPAQTKFTAGETRNLAREIEFRIQTEKTKKLDRYDIEGGMGRNEGLVFEEKNDHGEWVKFEDLTTPND